MMAADRPTYDTPEDLADRADEVVEGTVVSVTTEMRPLDTPLESDDPRLNPYAGTGRTPSPEELAENALPYTVSALVVTDSFHSDALRNGDKIYIREVGGVVDGINYQFTEIAEPLRRGDKGLFFLIQDEANSYVIVGMDQGRFASRSEKRGARSWQNPRHTLSEEAVTNLADTMIHDE